MSHHTARWARAVVLPATVLLLLCSVQDLAGKAKKPPGGGDKTGPSYTIIPLTNPDGTFVNGGVSDINIHRQIAGFVSNALDELQAACWTTTEADGVVEFEFHPLAGGDVASAINDDGEIVGSAEVDGHVIGLYWADKDAAPLVLSCLEGDNECHAVSINKDGVVCGLSDRPVPRLDENGDQMLNNHGDPIFDAGSTAVAWRINGNEVYGPTALPTPDFSATAAINDEAVDGSTTIVGSFKEMHPVYGITVTKAVAWQLFCELDGTLTVGEYEVLADLGRAEGINASGVVCGEQSTPTTTYEAVVWSDGSPQLLDQAKFIYTSWAHDINNNGVIVGKGDYWKNFSQGLRAAVWPSASGKMILLNDFLDRDSPIATLTTARAINDSGDIIGIGWDGNGYIRFLAIPK